MVRSTCLIILTVLHLSVSKDCVDINPRSLDSQWEKKLHKDLDKCFDVMEPPSNKTFVQIRIMMKYFTMDAEDGSFFMFSWTTLTWTDERLKWNPQEYNGIADTYFWSYDYWIPILIQKNVAEQDDLPYYEKCKINYRGKVVCIPRMENEGRCTTDVRNWPYDTQNCSLTYGIHHMQKGIILQPRTNKTVGTFGAEYGAEWIITDYYESRTPNDSVQIKVTFTLERNAEGLGAVVIFPPVLLATLTLLTMFKDVNKFSRFWLTCFAVLCHFFFLSTISDHVPTYGTEIPFIVIFFRFSLLMTSVLVMVVLGLKGLKNRVTVPPTWICSVNNLVFNSYGKYLIWPRWEHKKESLNSDSEDVKIVEAWNDFVNILNTVCLIFCAVIYLILYLVYVPQPPPLIF